MSRTGAAFSVRFLRNGDQIVIVRDIIKGDGTGAGLYQAVDPISGSVSPDWTQAANQPIIQISARSSAGYPVEITNVVFAYAGVNLSFTYNGATWVDEGSGKPFKSRISNGKYELKIVGNLASSTVVSNQQINYEVSYTSNAMSDVVQGSVDVIIQQSGSDSHLLQITTNHVELSADITSATLTAEAMYGTESVTIGHDGYTIEWYQDGVLINDQTSSILTVTRDMVTGGSIFIAKLKKNGNLVAQDSQRISDIADEYQITHTPTSAGSNYVAPNHNAIYTLAVEKNGASYGGAVTYAWQVYNALGVAKGSGTGATVTVTPSDCLVGTGDGAYYADCDVQVTADF